jgi:hypothetical protein
MGASVDGSQQFWDFWKKPSFTVWREIAVARWFFQGLWLA